MIIKGTVLDTEQSIDVSPVTVLDRSRYQCNGVMSANPPTWVRLPSGLWVLRFNGTDNYVDVAGTGGTIQPATQYTVLIWCRPLNFAVDWRVAFGGIGNDPDEFDCQIFLHATGKFGAYACRFDGDVSSITVLAANTWALIGLSAQGIVRNYWVNGLLDRTFNVGGTTAQWSKTGHRIGAADTPVAQFFAGDIGRVLARKYLMTAGQIQNYFESTRWLYGV